MESEGEESAAAAPAPTAPYLGLVGAQIDDEPYSPSPDEPPRPLGSVTPAAAQSNQATPRPAEEEYDLTGLHAEAFDHDAAKERIKQYKREAEDRRRKKMQAQQREAERLSAELEKERERQAASSRAREAEQRQRREEQIGQQRRERDVRARARAELSSAPPPQQREPLYKRREREAAQAPQHVAPETYVEERTWLDGDCPGHNASHAARNPPPAPAL
uniref:Uncharacterized protein n=1 Tax=Emiliania huxleyi TaxID=2903 RepID=A0A6V2MTT5_EMIHU|mmetsp:Transcript_24214/g.70678  ORF Transcript_24214/g.70678 Transcript_24214/m.70678 type:complete len:218 (+) Transcript_24214:56-709(+)